uniref:Uncharacterized protein n=1 Tax=Arundo donax TaxID=35708 RepID=A0A0A9ET22_ARUDO
MQAQTQASLPGTSYLLTGLSV